MAKYSRTKIHRAPERKLWPSYAKFAWVAKDRRYHYASKRPPQEFVLDGAIWGRPKLSLDGLPRSWGEPTKAILARDAFARGKLRMRTLWAARILGRRFVKHDRENGYKTVMHLYRRVIYITYFGPA